MSVGITHYLLIGAVLFAIGAFGIFLNRNKIISVLLSIEIMLLAVTLNFVAFSQYLNDLVGQVFVLFVLTMTAAKVAIGLAILFVFSRNQKSTDVDDGSRMKG